MNGQPEVVRLGHLRCHAVTTADALALIASWIEERQGPHLLVTPNIAHIHQARTSPVLRQAYARATLATPDGWPVVRAVRVLAGGAEVDRVTGADLVPTLLQHPWRVMVVGGAPGSAARLAERVADAGTPCTLGFEPLPPAEFADPTRRSALVARICDFEPDLVLIGIGAPKQEALALEVMEVLGRGVVIPVGAAIDFASGSERRCPPWLRRIGGEWLFRLARDPRRLWKRYALSAPYFAWVFAVAYGRRILSRARSEPT